jgi:TonB family protein
VPPQKLLRVHQVTESDEEDADESDVAAPYSTPIPGQPTPAKPSPYDSSSQRAGAQGIQSANGQQPAPVVRTSAPPSNEVASASVPPPPGESSQEYSSERYAGAQPGTVGQPGLHPGVTSSYRDPDAAIAGDLPRSGRGSRGVVPQNPDEVEVSSGIMAGYLISAPRPDYPTLARLAHIGGPVVLQAVIAKNGTVLATHVLSGHRLLRGAAEDAVRRWRFRPYVVDGHPVEVSTIITLRFRQKR